MGNQMFQYALGRALAIKNNTELGLDLASLLDRTPRQVGFTFRNYDLDLFKINAQIVSQADVPFIHRTLKGGRIALILESIKRRICGGKGKECGFAFDPAILSLGPDTYLDGYWQSYKYFESIADTLRADFAVRTPLPANIQVLQKEIQGTNAVCLHIRRGDYVGNAFHEVVTKDYYHNALQMLSTKGSIDHLYVFSDDIAWCRDNLSFEYPTTFVGDEYAGERGIGHFALMCSCKHFIIPNSSFAWWSAWLGESPDKIVIAPKQWFGDASIETTERIPEDWIRI